MHLKITKLPESNGGKPDMAKILVETNKREYITLGNETIPWERGERVIRIEPVIDSEDADE